MSGGIVGVAIVGGIVGVVTVGGFVDSIISVVWFQGL